MGVEAGALEHDIDAGAQPRAQHAGHGRAHAAGGAGARKGSDVASGGAGEFFGVICHARLQGREHVRQDAFLRPVDAGGAVLAQKGVGHVAQHLDFDLAQAGRKSGEIYARNADQIRAAAGQSCAGLVKKARTQGAQHAHAAVVGGAAADAQQDFLRPGVQRGQNQLAGSGAAGGQGVEALDAGKARGLRHFQRRRAFAVQEGIGGLDGFAQGRVHARKAPRSTQGGQKRLHSALASVGDGDAHALRLRKMRKRRRLQKPRHARGVQRTFERIRRKDKLHVATSIAPPGENSARPPRRRRVASSFLIISGRTPHVNAPGKAAQPTGAHLSSAVACAQPQKCGILG